MIIWQSRNMTNLKSLLVVNRKDLVELAFKGDRHWNKLIERVNREREGV